MDEPAAPRISSVVDTMFDTVIRVLPGIDLQGRNRAAAEALVYAAYEYADLDFNVDKAVVWGDNFCFPSAVHTRDAAELEALGYDLTDLVRRRQLALLSGRLNHDRIAGRDPSDLDTGLLHDLVEGIRIPVDPEFEEDRLPPEHDKTYKIAHSAVDKMWFELYEARFVLLIPTMSMARIPRSVRLNYSPPGWARKRVKAKGRCICDFSRKNKKGFPLNTDWVKQLVKGFYGEIEPCRIEDLVAMVLSQIDRVGNENVTLSKMDLLGAFNLCFLRAEDAGLLAMELSEDLTVVSLVGNFGSTVTPYAFNVGSRQIIKDFKAKAKGDAGICCDDLMGACTLWDLTHDMAVARSCIESVFGEYSVADGKTEVGRCLDFIGWHVDLDRSVLGIARHNILKTFYGFCLASGQAYLSVRELQRLASRAGRYSMVCRYMRPFSHYIYSASAGYLQLETRVPVSDDLRMVIDLWLVFLLVMELEPTKFNRPLASFREVMPEHTLNQDASLTGVGLIVSRFTHHGAVAREPQEVLDPGDGRVAAASGYQLPYDLRGDSSYQNAVEFISIVVGLCLMASLGLYGGGVLVQGDSTTGLSWTADEKFRAGRSSAAVVFFMQLQQRYAMSISDTEHLPGVINPSDPLSRGVSPEQLGYPAAVCYDMRSNPTLVAVIASFDPTVVLSLREDLPARWRQNEAWIDMLLSAGGGWDPH